VNRKILAFLHPYLPANGAVVHPFFQQQAYKTGKKVDIYAFKKVNPISNTQ